MPRAERHRVARLDRKDCDCLTATRDIGRPRASPCVPETTIATLPGLDFMMSCGRSEFVGMVAPQSCAISVVASMLRPRNATFGGRIHLRNRESCWPTMKRRAEAGDHQTAVASARRDLQARPHSALTLVVARPVDVGRIGHRSTRRAFP